MAFVSSAWVVIFTALTIAHSAGPGYVFDSMGPVVASGSSTCNYSMEIIPMTYVDNHGRRETGWVTKMSNCYGGSTQFSNLPTPTQPRALGVWEIPEFR